MSTIIAGDANAVIYSCTIIVRDLNEAGLVLPTLDVVKYVDPAV
jgi:hypothetical protein